jgi:tRNA (guanine-N7-)-methyltransferase
VIETLESYQTEIQSPPYILSPKTFFSRAKKIEIEIGCGKGRFLAETALQRPNDFYVGIESAHVYARYAEKRLIRRNIQNVRIVDWSAETLLPFLKSETVKRFHIYFPDPWPKKRHQKRRVWKEEFVEMLDRILIPNGKIYFATDHLDYFELVLDLLKKKESPFALEKKGNARFFKDAGEATSYEKKFMEEKRQIGYASFIKQCRKKRPTAKKIKRK